MNNETVKFEVGPTYEMRSVCDYNCVWLGTLVKRTEKFVTMYVVGQGDVRCKVNVRDGVEEIMPLGRYSMAPVMKADKVA